MIASHARQKVLQSGRRAAALALLLVAAGVPAGCAKKPGVVFPPAVGAPAWPPPPERARIVYVGKIEKDSDLKPGLNGFEAMGEAMFGKKESRSMLTPLAVCTDSVPGGMGGGGAPGGRLYVADSNTQNVHVFDFATRKYATWAPPKGAPPFAQPVALAWHAGLNVLLVSDSVGGTIVGFDRSGRYMGTWGPRGLFQRPVGIAVDPSPAGRGRVLVADARLHQVLVLTPGGELIRRLGERGEGPVQFNYPTNIAIDRTGTVYVSDSLNFRVQQFDGNLNFTRQIGKKGDMPGYFAQPKGVAVDSEGHLYVVDAQFENVQIYDRDGHVLMDFGEEGSRPGEFWLPAGIWIDAADRLYIADSYNRRIQVFDYKKAPTEVQP
jgi:DNA-binding beta-propeller fold protein YncE